MASSSTSLNPEEDQYLDLIRDILDHGEHRPDRTGTGTYSLFAPTPLRFSLSRPKASSPSSQDPSTRSTSTNTQSSPSQLSQEEEYDLILPLLTTKRVFLRAVITELLWFIAGSTSSKSLSSAGIKIWDGNGSRSFLDSVGLSHREEGDLGPVYGFQWRHFGAEYSDCHADYTRKGVDQLAEVVKKLKENPYDRRIILSAWNPADLKKMALPPCHMFAQFYVSFPSKIRGRLGEGKGRRSVRNGANGYGAGAARGEEKAGQNGVNGHSTGVPDSQQEQETVQKEKGTLHTILYQRSNDMGLGVPFNIASYALLTHMLAYVCDLIPGSLTHTMGDAHVYLDHVEALETQLEREPRVFPTLEIRRTESKAAGTVDAIDGWQVDDFVVKGYDPHKAVAMKMSV